MWRSEIVEATGKMPFAGRHWVKYWFLKGREAARGGEQSQKLNYTARLGAFALIHAVQTGFGINELIHYRGQGAARIGIDAAFTLANLAATYTQAYLAAKVFATSHQDSSEVFSPDNTETLEDRDTLTESTLEKVTTLDTVVTVGGMAMFWSTLH